jgi:hypothetical protein
MSWWEVILDKINTRDKLFTPGRGPEGTRKKPFTILSKDLERIFILSGKKKAMGSGFGNSVFILGGMSKGQKGRSCNHTFHRKDRESSIKKLALF